MNGDDLSRGLVVAGAAGFLGLLWWMFRGHPAYPPGHCTDCGKALQPDELGNKMCWECCSGWQV
ncbi:MAG TPA: hypothetical protein VF409_05360 [Sphingomonas sp.]